MLQIFAALCEVQDFAVCEGVCRAWRRLLPDCQPSTVVASRQQPLQQLLWLAAHRKLMRNIDEFIIRDDITDAAADVELLNLLDLAFKRARGLTYLSLEVQVLMCRNRYLSDAEWAMMPAEVQLDELVTFEVTAAALDHLSEAMYIDAGHITVEAIAHLPSKVPHLRSLSIAQAPRDMVMTLSCMPDLETLCIFNGEESEIHMIEGFSALATFRFTGKCKSFSAPGIDIADATTINIEFS